MLSEIWTGAYETDHNGNFVPVIRSARLSDIPEKDRSQWWEIPNNGTLAKRILENYPLLLPVIGPEGELVDVQVTLDEHAQERIAMDTELQNMAKKEAVKRGYRARRGLRPKGLMPFLSERRES